VVTTQNLHAGAFLKARRRSIAPDACWLGPYARLPARYGKPVTQEEVAEAAGVSRVWYAMIESGAAVRTSPQLLDKLARALMLSPEERLMLVLLAFPELQLSAGFEGATVSPPGA